METSHHVRDTLTREQAFRLAPLVSRALHMGRPIGKFKTQAFKAGTVKSVDIHGYRFITQNKEKDSEWGKLAKAGHQISWVIELHSGAWIGRVIDGTLVVL